MARRLVRWIFVAGFLAVGVLAAGVVVLARTEAGHGTLLRLALREASSAVQGSVRVGGIRAGNLLAGFTLHRVRIDDREARPVFEADSVEVRYSLRDLLRREIVLVPARIWGMRLTLESAAEGEPLNVETLFGSGPPAEGSAPAGGSAPSVALRQVEIQRGEVTLRLPAGDVEPGSPWVVEEVPGRVGLFRVLRFTGIDATIAEAELEGPLGGPRIGVESLSFTARVVTTPFRISAFRGEIEVERRAVTVRASPIRIQGSPFVGRVRVAWGAAGRGVGVVGDLNSEGASLRDFRWIAPGLPDGEGPIALSVTGPIATGEWRVRTPGFRIGRSMIGGNATLRLGDPLAIASAEIDLLPLELADVDSWVADSIGVRGSVRGRVDVSGDLRRLDLVGAVDYQEEEGALPVGVAFEGGLALAAPWGFSAFSVTLDPFRYGSLAAVVPGLAFDGEGRAEATLEGSPAQGLGIEGRLEHWGPGWPRSSVSVAGTVREVGESWELALAAGLDSLSMDGIGGGLGRDVPLSGMVSGTVSAEGPLEDLRVTGRLASSAGIFDGSTRFDAREPFRRYHIDGAIEDFQLHAIVPDLPEPTVLTGDLVVDGEGSTLETLAGSASLSLRTSRIAGLEMDGFRADLSAVDGRLLVEEFDLASQLLTATGSGSLPLREGQSAGEVAFTWSTSSLAGLRPLLFASGEDTLALDGRARGELRLVGSVTDLTFEGFVDADSVAYREYAFAQGRADFLGEWSRDGSWSIGGTAGLSGIGVDRFAFERADAELEYRPGMGRYSVDVSRNAGQAYHLAGALAHDSLGVDLAVDDLELAFDSVRWAMVQPANVRIEGSRFEVDYLRMVRSAGGPEETRVDATGIIDLVGNSRFRVQLSGVGMDRLAGILQTDVLPGGVLSLVLDLAGPAAAPGIAATVRVDDFSLGGARLSRVDGILDYRDQLVVGSVVGSLEGRTLLNLAGSVPIDLSLSGATERILDREVDVTLSADSLPAATALAFVEALEEVSGSLAGRIHIGGTLRDVHPTGRIALRAGSVFLPGLGIRPNGIEAELELFGDSVAVLLSANSGGEARVEGMVEFEELTDPRFDLTVSTAGFQPVDRRDVVVEVGGDVRLTGTYTAPEVTGDVRVLQGDLFLEEFIRAAQVVDLTDPSLLDVVDTTLVALRPVVAAQNPFLRNLRMDVALALPGDFWLRSREMEVEIGGDLAVAYDRAARDLSLTGGLQAVRGTYTLYGKQFQVQSGSVSFAGTPGLDPALDIQAATRLRPQNAEPLNLTARVQGTLTGPRVTLASDAQPAIAESDLISYLLFGRPSYALARGEQDQFRQTLFGGTVTLGTGLVTSGVGTELARQLGIDHLALRPLAPTQAGLADPSLSDITQLHRNTQVEIGQYWHPFFLAVVLPPLNAKVDANYGARVEVQLSDSWVVEGYVEDRFARQGGTGFGTFGTRLSSVMGLALFREWGY